MIDEVFIRGGKLTHAFGHTADLLIYWNRYGDATTAERKYPGCWNSLHEEAYSAVYTKRDPRYDLTPEEILKSQKLI